MSTEPFSGRHRLALALDVSDLDTAVALAGPLQPWFGVAKVGLELFSATGPDSVRAMRQLGFDVFVDLKLHDIPTTVANAARVLGRLGARYVTMHTAGGAAMLRAGAEALAEGAQLAGFAAPVALGVTVLTSETDVSVFDARLAAAIDGGCGGVVCAVGEAASVKRRAPGLLVVTPGIRPAGAVTHDQARPATAAQAFAAGSDLLVIGRAVTHAADPAGAARALVALLG